MAILQVLISKFFESRQIHSEEILILARFRSVQLHKFNQIKIQSLKWHKMAVLENLKLAKLISRKF